MPPAHGPLRTNRHDHTEWMPFAKLSLPLAGLGLDAVYESYAQQITDDALKAGDGEG